jgi:hypothetical protein
MYYITLRSFIFPSLSAESFDLNGIGHTDRRVKSAYQKNTVSGSSMNHHLVCGDLVEGFADGQHPALYFCLKINLTLTKHSSLISERNKLFY